MTNCILKQPNEVPEFNCTEQFEKRNNFCVCIFVINEGEKIKKQLASMAYLHSIIDIIVADGGSSDDSLNNKVLEDANVRTLLTKTGAGRLSAQMRMAFYYAMQEGYNGVITIDGNGKDNIEAIPDFIKLLENGLDHIQGSRFIKGGHHKNTPFSRWFAVRFIHAPLISLASHFWYTDTTNGFRAYSRKFLLSPNVQVFRNIFSDYELHYYLAIRAARLKFMVTETAVSRVYPDSGKIPTKISPFRGNIKVLKTLFKAALQQYNPKQAE